MAKLAAEWQAFRADLPGERFRHHYDRSQQSSRPARIARALVGILLVAIGIVLLFIPGPGLLVALFGLALLSSQSHMLASALDRAEPRVRDFAGRVRARFKRWRTGA
jgi:UPF0716 family protein affecting phage T7 exclusion